VALLFYCCAQLQPRILVVCSVTCGTIFGIPQAICSCSVVKALSGVFS
jgi:uncharacterized membrane protein YraQ (UPF0718 family)